MIMRQVKMKEALKAISVAGLASVLIVAGCNNKQHYPDQKDAVNSALTQNNLGSIHVSQDRDKGVMTLTGNVPDEAQKAQAEKAAKGAAPSYTIADEIGVVPPNNASATKSALSDTDTAIEDNFKAELKKNRALNDQSIDVKSKNGTVVLTGSVKTMAQKKKAGVLAKKVPNVQQVVNELKVEPKKHSTANQ
ncbi:MAG TPA: BON domain-containing protein [Acidobacteriaceae bacterium]|nr:BON domain-containing protein [Acidobacteriaceae bacterium]